MIVLPRTEALCYSRDFEPEPWNEASLDRHYLLYASAGAIRFEAGGKRWSLAPARAALIKAGETFSINITQRVTACSVLFTPGFIPDPPSPLTVFEMTPLARELALECRAWGPTFGSLPPYALRIFATLGDVVLRLAETPSPTAMPAPRSPALARALELTEERIDRTPDFARIARDSGQSQRALARRFAAEMGMTWRAALRRLRMIRAIEALAGTSMTVTEIALSVGYSSLSAFNAAFREFTGKTPSAYRASFGEPFPEA